MKVTYATILNSIPALQQLQADKIPGAIALKVAKASKELEGEADNYRQSLRKILESLDISVEDGTFSIPEDKKEEFEKEHRELLQAETDLAVNPLTGKDVDRLDVSPATLAPLLGWFVNEEEDS